MLGKAFLLRRIASLIKIPLRHPLYFLDAPLLPYYHSTLRRIIERREEKFDSSWNERLPGLVHHHLDHENGRPLKTSFPSSDEIPRPREFFRENNKNPWNQWWGGGGGENN